MFVGTSIDALTHAHDDLMRFEPESLLSVQLGRRSQLALPERNLWAAVLADAVFLARKPIVTFRSKRNESDAARAWIASDDEGVESFVWVCGVLDLKPEAIRDAIARSRGRALRFTEFPGADARSRNARARNFMKRAS